MQRSFYYWKTGFSLSPKEKNYLRDLSVQHLYIKLFDVSWSNERQAALPVAKSLFREAPPENTIITPVVFITNETLVKIDAGRLNELSGRIASLLSSISSSSRLKLSGEVQIDCDWTGGTKDKYFSLLKSLRQTAFFQGKKLSATIRLHQLKYLSDNGVPPVDKGLLMAYNMGNLRHPETGNSIIEPSELKKYIRHMDDYPLPLDVALPLFEWYVLFRQNSYKGLVQRLQNDSLPWKNDRHVFLRDTTVDGYAFRAGDWLRRERSDAGEVKTCANLLAKKLKNGEVNVILYHLDEYYLNKYQLYELESFYNSFL